MCRFHNLLTGVCLFLTVPVIFFVCEKDSPTDPETPTNNWLPITESVNGTLGEIQGIPLLTLWGIHYEQGYAHG